MSDKIHQDCKKFLDFCQEHDVVYRRVSGGLRFRECPFCGDQKWKAWLFENHLRGKCPRCEANYSAQSFLTAHGFEKSQVSPVFSSIDRELRIDGDDEDYVQEVPEAATQDGIWLQDWMNIRDWPEHPASRYAINRKLPEELFDDVVIDVKNNGVVFLCRNGNGDVIGYQTRFVNPLGPNKTQTMSGFPIHNHILCYPRMGAPILAVEGPFTAVSAYCLGYTAICCFGSSLTKTQMQGILHIAELAKSPKILAGFDQDAAGNKATHRLVSYCTDKSIPIQQAIAEYGNDINDSHRAGKGVLIKDVNPQSLISLNL